MTYVSLIEGTQTSYRDVEKRVQHYMHHPYLQVSGVRQDVSRFHYDVAWVILKVAGVKPEEAFQIVSALLLLQQGLSIHDDVEGPQTLQRQLFVLAGDYNSSQYYFTLAQLGDTALLNALSDSVVRITEAKMTWLQMEHVSPSEFMTMQETIHGDLLRTLAASKAPDATTEQNILRVLIRLYALRKALERHLIPRLVGYREAFALVTEEEESMGPLRLLPNRHVLGDMCERYLQSVKQVLENQAFTEGNRP